MTGSKQARDQDARARIEAAFPKLRPQEVRYFGEGCDFQMFEVDGTWLFRIPKRAREIERLKRERALLEKLAGRLPVQIPRFDYFAPGVAGYRRLDGLAMARQVPRRAFACSLGEFAAALHAVDVGDMAMPGELDTGGMQGFFDDVRKGLEAARPNLNESVFARCEAMLNEPVPPPYAGARCLVHNDIYPAHVLLREDGGIRAVLDWGDAIVGNPARDFAVAYFWGGEPYLQTALAHYGQPIDEPVARFLGVGTAISHLTYGARIDDEVYVQTGLESITRMATR